MIVERGLAVCAAAVFVDGANQLISPVPILSGNLSNVTGQVNIVGDIFTTANGLVSGAQARYLRFEPLVSTYGNNNVGLNEIEIYDLGFVNPNKAAGKPIIDGSGAWDGGVPCVGQPFNGGTFPAGRVTDESVADANTGRTSYWLGREYCDNEYFTVDLEGIYDLDEVVLRNAHNAQHNDSGTGEFVLYGATQLDGANQLVDPFVITAGDLTNTSGQLEITGDSFMIGDDVPPVRYLKFQALTYLESATNGRAGLNELEVYGTVIPEPGTTALAIVALACVGMVARRRRKA